VTEQTVIVGLLVGAAVLAIMATLGIVRRERHSAEDRALEGKYAVSTEGQKRCPYCGFGNLVIERDCASCGRRLPG
jgi:hypothetical protein